ncbi:MAG: hypothetical protein COB35_10830 [Gammaproteobacteria bacterium]|nr:MAG: hypothetical protein COB35_10830 [Gammaproteobacteria bacterium]
MKRIDSVDTIRLFAIIAVIAIHTKPFAVDSTTNETYYYLNIIINQLARFAVPFFFVISGYFFGQKIRKGNDVVETAKAMIYRVGTIYLVWSLIYLLPYNLTAIIEYGILGPLKVSYWHFISLLNDPLTIPFKGTKIHLWFLISLIYSVIICSVFVYYKMFRSLFFFAIALYLFGVLSKAYADSPLGITVNFNTRNGPFLGTLFFVIGYYISDYSYKKYWLYYGLTIFVIGCLFHFSEIYLLMKYYGSSLFQDYVFGTILMGVGAALIALSNHPILQNKILSKMGSMTLGIYVSHVVFVDILRPFDRIYHSAIWQLGYIVLVLTCSILLVLILSRTQFTRKFIF